MRSTRSFTARRRPGGRTRVAGAAALAVVASLAASLAAGSSTAGASSTAPLYANENVTVTSFDGTPLDVSFYPATGLQVGQTAPTVLDPSAWSMPAYPQGLPDIGQISLSSSLSFGMQMLGPIELENAGYNVVTWDNRGWYSSGGEVEVDNPNYEGRDVTAIINWLATQPAAQLRGPDYPVVGMTGLSYGGGAQLAAAVVDHRLAAIEPNMSWYSLVSSLMPNGIAKSGWGNLLCGIGTAVGARYTPELTKICASSESGVITPDEVTYGNAASPGPVMSQITTPTLLIGGTADTLFPEEENVSTYEALFAAGTPVQMVWFCGGHGVCTSNPGPANYVTNIEMNFLAKYLKGAAVSTGPTFQYVDQTGTWRGGSSYPLPAAGKLSASGNGWLSLSTGDSSGFLGIEATPASNALNVPISVPWLGSEETVGAPSLTLTYQGVGSETTTSIAAQLVDTSTNTVLGSQATAIPVTLDGNLHTITLPLNIVAWNFTPSSKVELQLTDASDLFFNQTANGLLHFQKIGLSVPLVSPGTSL